MEFFMSFINSQSKNCSFFGHRKIEITKELKQKVKEVIEDLIVNKNVSYFLFGSKSKFNDLCHLVVTKLKEKYSYIERIEYTCKSEDCLLEKDKNKWEEINKQLLKNNSNLLFYDNEFEFKNKYVAGRASYIERNFSMIDDSFYCVCYCKLNSNVKSGTQTAYQYAIRKKKQIINVCK